MFPRLLDIACGQIRTGQSSMGIRILWRLQYKFLTDSYRLFEIATADILIHIVPI